MGNENARQTTSDSGRHGMAWHWGMSIALLREEKKRRGKAWEGILNIRSEIIHITIPGSSSMRRQTRRMGQAKQQEGMGFPPLSLIPA